eukprot:GHVR01068630.1.p1 GENE.GHVR01068630.1~~GHVR01068630.1.p1  ORF type:complete len:226 (-),score=30.98 GHVR01068630.1:254-931(-)
MKPRDIAILGGSFDPPTNGHMLIAAQVVQLGLAEEVWIVPCGMRTDKTSVCSPEERLKMCELAVESNFTKEFPVKVHPIEIENGEFIPTFYLMKRFESDYPDCCFWLIVGTDVCASLDTFVKARMVKEQVRMILVGRGEIKTLSDMPPGHLPDIFVGLQETATEKLFPLILTDISSTVVRQRLRDGACGPTPYEFQIQGLVPKLVVDYIGREKLYTPEKLNTLKK